MFWLTVNELISHQKFDEKSVKRSKFTAGNAHYGACRPIGLHVVSDVVEKNVDSSSKSNPLRRRGKNYDAST